MGGVLFEWMFILIWGVGRFWCLVSWVSLVSGVCRLCLMLMVNVLSGDIYSMWVVVGCLDIGFELVKLFRVYRNVVRVFLDLVGVMISVLLLFVMVV